MHGIASVRALLIAIFVFMAGGGSLTTLVSVRLEGADASPLVIGAVATAYFAGLAVGSLRVFPIIARVGHIRAFSAFVSLFSASALAYILHADPWMWAALRFVEGFCVAGVYVCLESWLNDKAEPASRGSILAFYMVALYSGQAAGQFLLNLGAGSQALPFVAASMLLSLAVLPVALTRRAPPPLPVLAPFSLPRLYRASPMGVAGAVANGVVLGGFYGLGPVFARGAGLDLSETAAFMSTVIFGGVLLQWPLGRLSDVFDRRRVILGVLAGTVMIALGVAFSADWPNGVRLVLGGLFGGVGFALYPLCVAHTNDHVSAEDRVAASAGLVLAYSTGAVAGPVAASAAIMIAGPEGLFLFITATAAAALMFGAWRMTARASVPNAEQGRYQVLPRTTPAAASLDPLAE